MTDPASAPSADPAGAAARTAIAAAYAAARDEVHALSRAIHADPELAFAEHRAHDRCADLLETHGFTLERGVAELPTAFRATRGTGSLVASLCVEYDALPEIGHGCGHNIIAGSSIGAALALAEQLADLDVTLQVIGTPAEEHGGGKQLLIDRGVFEGVHLSLMTHAVPHTDTYDVLGSTSQAVGRWRATYTGRATHAAANPSDGINANDAAVIAQVAAGLLRQRLRDGQRLSLVPQQSGVTNVVPELAIVDFECRALAMDEFEQLQRSLVACIEAGALATGCGLTIEETEPVYEPLLQDEVLGRHWNAAMERLGRPLAGSLGVMRASTDMGNVSQRVPSIHPFVGITGAGGALHTREFAEHALSAEGLRLMDDAAVAMAWVIRDVAADPRAREAVLARAAELAAPAGVGAGDEAPVGE
ncbi:M20 family metallopeptidase [Brachybacterium sp. J144]|uniref:M20 family metallopeptidase n=1 Tax=Brachybacterium sp. J144 TaxID=3116487 RepID=UPI002E774E45|nr:M20 family metallopeptidase [Brachybacterium sp. J144]MEE1650164.1 M20 family metallopeptidase [Brachybacterium sp. J144]